MRRLKHLGVRNRDISTAGLPARDEARGNGGGVDTPSQTIIEVEQGAMYHASLLRRSFHLSLRRIA
jgi:hypothetical protein